VRSSATAEDLPTAGFAGQHDTFLNVRGEAMLLDAIRRCNASLFTDRAISYRIDQSFDHFNVALSVGLMKMVRADLAASGVMFSLDTETGFRDVVFITGAYGLGENVVKGTVDPDEFLRPQADFPARPPCGPAPRLGPKAGEDGLMPMAAPVSRSPTCQPRRRTGRGSASATTRC
jgi:pyruvate, water dikinase